VLVLAAQMRSPSIVPPQLDLVELGDGDAQGFLDAPEAGFPRLFRSLGHLLEEVTAEGIVEATCRAVRFPHKLGNDVQVPDGREE